MLYFFGDQNLFIFPVKNARGQEGRYHHGDRYTHWIHFKALGITITTE